MDVHPIHGEFDYLTVTRAGGITGAVERVHLDATMQADVHRFLGMDGHTRLDASTAADTIRQLGNLVEHGGIVPAGSKRAGGDVYQYQIELGWKGQVYRFHADGLGVDEALHGTIALADRLLELEPAPETGPRQPKAMLLADAGGAHLPANGNPGTVPPWLQPGTPRAGATLAMRATDGPLRTGAWAGHDLAEVDAARASLDHAVSALRSVAVDPDWAITSTRAAIHALDRAEHAATSRDAATAALARALQPEVGRLLTAATGLDARTPPAAVAALATRYDAVLDRLERLLGDADWE